MTTYSKVPNCFKSQHKVTDRLKRYWRKINVDNFLGSSIVVEDNDMKTKEESLKTISSPLVGISAENI